MMNCRKIDGIFVNDKNINLCWNISSSFSMIFVFLSANLLLTSLYLNPPLNWITLSQHASDNNNRMIQLTDVFCALFI